MKKNVGSVDKIIRYTLAIVLLALYYFGTLTGVWGTATLIAAAILVITSMFSFCGLYTIFGMNTCKVPETK
jgi:hypothetical protein